MLLKIHDTAKTAVRTAVFAVYIKHNSISFCVVRTVLAPCQYRGLPQAERYRLVVPFPRIDARQRWCCSLVSLSIGYLPAAPSHSWQRYISDASLLLFGCYAWHLYFTFFSPSMPANSTRRKKQQIDSKKKLFFRACRRTTISLQMRNLQPN